jgi:hypothetical protein
MWNPAKDWVGWLLIVSLVGGSLWGHFHPRDLRHVRAWDGDVPLYWRAILPYTNRIKIHDGPGMFLRQFKELPPAVGHLWAASLCHADVTSGGFEQFFSSPRGLLAPEAVEGFRAMGLADAADVVQQAMDVFPKPYPRDRDRRSAVLDEKLQDSQVSELFENLDQRFVELMTSESGDPSGRFEAAANRYARDKLK